MTTNGNQPATIETMTRDTAPPMARLVLDSLLDRNLMPDQLEGVHHADRIIARTRSGSNFRLRPALVVLLGIETEELNYSERRFIAEQGNELSAIATEHAALAGITGHLLEEGVSVDIEDPQLARGLAADIKQTLTAEPV